MDNKKRSILLRKALAHLEQDKLSETIEICTQIIDSKSDDKIATDAYHYRGTAYDKKNLYDKATADLESALDLEPDNEETIRSHLDEIKKKKNKQDVAAKKIEDADREITNAEEMYKKTCEEVKSSRRYLYCSVSIYFIIVSVFYGHIFFLLSNSQQKALYLDFFVSAYDFPLLFIPILIFLAWKLHLSISERNKFYHALKDAQEEKKEAILLRDNPELAKEYLIARAHRGKYTALGKIDNFPFSLTNQ